MSESKAVISIRHLKKTFDDGKTYILKDVNLEIPKGQITSIIGFSGTGKSVLMKHILGLYKATEGTLEILGHDVGRFSKDDWISLRAHFGMLFQHAALFDSMTTIDNVCFPLREHRGALGEEEIERIAQHKLHQVGIEAEHYDKLPSNLSGGMRKRVGLARALALNPQILIYDEPTTGLDPILTEVVDNLIVETHRQNQCTSIIVSHDLFSAFRFSDNIVMLNKGEVLLSGAPKAFYESQVPLVKKFLEKGFKGRDGV